MRSNATQFSSDGDSERSRDSRKAAWARPSPPPADPLFVRDPWAGTARAKNGAQDETMSSAKRGALDEAMSSEEERTRLRSLKNLVSVRSAFKANRAGASNSNAAAGDSLGATSSGGTYLAGTLPVPLVPPLPPVFAPTSNDEAVAGQHMQMAINELLACTKSLKETFGVRLEKAEATLQIHDDALRLHQDKLLDVFERLNVFEKGEKEWKTQQAQLHERIKQAEAAPPKPVGGSGFGRGADPTKLKANSPSLFAAAVLQVEIDLLLEAGGFQPGCARVLGTGVGKKFQIQFLGAGQLGAHNARAFVENCLKDDDGKWVPLHIKDPQNIPARLYVGPDVGPQQERMEILTGILCKVVGEVSGTQAYPRKREGEVFLNFLPVASLAIPDSKTIELSFNCHACEELGLDRDKVQRLFSERTTRSAPRWTKCS
jgi:hypothetical protein